MHTVVLASRMRPQSEQSLFQVASLGLVVGVTRGGN